MRRAEDLLEAVRSTPLPLPDGGLLALSISVGVAHVPQHSTDRRGLYTPPTPRCTTPSGPAGAGWRSPEGDRRHLDPGEGVLGSAPAVR